jgi:hypothetical protein
MKGNHEDSKARRNTFASSSFSSSSRFRAFVVAFVFSAAVASTGCLVVSLQPAYDDQSVRFDEGLLGQWENAEDGERATIERGEWRSYRISYTDRSATRVFQGNLTKAGAATLLDITEMRGVDPGPFLVPVHGILRVTLDGTTLTVARLDYDRFMRARTQKSSSLPPSAVDDRRNAVITAPTRDLRGWIGTAPADVFSAPATFTRKP